MARVDHLPHPPWFACALALSLAHTLLATDRGHDPVAVFSEVFPGYTRTAQEDGSPRPETYAFGEGGAWGVSEPASGVERLTFRQVALAAAGPLARAGYVPTPAPDQTDLLILVFWGRTLGSREGDLSATAYSNTQAATSLGGAALAASPAPTAAAPVTAQAANQAAVQQSLDAAAASARDSALWQISVENRLRDEIDDRNARILGYTEALSRARFVRHMAMGRDVIEEVGNNRYFVVLHAYDFRTAWREKKLLPRWSARISLQESGNDLEAELARMLAAASALFGRESRGLQRDVVPEGRTEIGPLEIIQYSPPK